VKRVLHILRRPAGAGFTAAVGAGPLRRFGTGDGVELIEATDAELERLMRDPGVQVLAVDGVRVLDGKVPVLG
jgi:hypothetical protein